MKKLTLLMATAVICLGIVEYSHSTELEVTHWWTSGGEAKAAKVFADAFNAGGDKWKDTAIGGGGGVARPVIVSRIVGGDPMGATQFNHGQQAEELVKAGLMLDLTDLSEKEGWRDFINPPSLLDACTYEGKIYCVPVNIHSWQWLWLNSKAFLDHGMKVPANWPEFKADVPKLKKAGIIPLATGDSWNIPGMFSVITAAIGGPDLHKKINIDKDMKAIKGEESEKIFEEMAFIRDNMIDKSYVGRQWNDATQMVISGKAAGQIMGDWAQGEFSVANMKQGKDYECLPGLGVYQVLEAGGDAFYFPKSKDPEKTAAQLRLASLMISKKVQVDFNLAKGSLPIRGDIDMATANGCMQKGLKILKDPNNILKNADVAWSRDTQAQAEDILTEFFADRAYTAKKAHSKWAELLSAGN